MNTKKILIYSLSFLFSVGIAVAQTSISGDSLCGSSASTACNFSHLRQLVRGFMFFIIGAGIPLLVVVISYRILVVWYELQQNKSYDYKEALKKAGESIVGFLILTLLFGGALTVLLTYLGVNEPVLKLLDLVTKAIVPVAHAEGMLPTPTKEINLFDALLQLFSLIMRFVVYPGLIIAWVFTGFTFVFAQGKPDTLLKAKKLLMGVVISTIVIMFVQTFLIMARGTVEQILPGSTSSQQEAVTQPVQEGGRTGVGKGGSCRIQDECKDGLSCSNGVCVEQGGRTGVERGGSCRVQEECKEGLLCNSNVCAQVGDSCTKVGGGYGRVTTDNQCQ